MSNYNNGHFCIFSRVECEWPLLDRLFSAHHLNAYLSLMMDRVSLCKKFEPFLVSLKKRLFCSCHKMLSVSSLKANLHCLWLAVSVWSGHKPVAKKMLTLNHRDFTHYEIGVSFWVCLLNKFLLYYFFSAAE